MFQIKGVLIWVPYVFEYSLLPFRGVNVASFFYNRLVPVEFPILSSSSLSLHRLSNAMSSPSSSYIQVGLDNLERPLNRSPSPRAQVRGFDWSSLLVD